MNLLVAARGDEEKSPSTIRGGISHQASDTGHAFTIHSRRFVGRSTSWSRMHGLPNLSSARPRNAPKSSAKYFASRSFGFSGGGFIGSQLQFQEADFKRERFLHIGVQQSLRLLQHAQVFQRLCG